MVKTFNVMQLPEHSGVFEAYQYNFWKGEWDGERFKHECRRYLEDYERGKAKLMIYRKRKNNVVSIFDDGPNAA